MKTYRTIEDSLREEYFRIIPLLERIYGHAEAYLLNILLSFRDAQQPYDKIELKKRIKSCDSAIDALRRRQEARLFDCEKENSYSLLQLHDLVGFRILAFPRALLESINSKIFSELEGWHSDPVYADEQKELLYMYKYDGFLRQNDPVAIEIQVMPMLIGLFSDVEHDALYKPKEEYKNINRALEMRQLKEEVVKSLNAFESAFERYVLRDQQ